VHWGRILRNIFSNWTSYVVTMLVGFLLAPVIVRSLGDTGYGLWTLLISMTGYFGLLDLGIRSSVGRFVARYLALNDEQNVNRTASTAFAMLACAGIIAFLLTLAVAVFLFDAFNVEPQYETAGRLALMLAGLNMSCALPLGVFSSVLIAMERYDVSSGVTVVGEVTRGAMVVWALRHGYGLVTLAFIALTITLVQYAAMALFAKRLYRPLKIGIAHVNWRGCRNLLGFSIYRFIWTVANQLIFYSDSIVIGIFLGAAAITPFAIASALINYGRNIVSLLTDTLYPVAARMDSRNDTAGLQQLLVLGTRMALLVTLPLCFGLLFLGRQFITLWMGPQYADSAVILMVLTIPQFGSMSQYASALVLTGMARHRALAYIALAEAVANVALSVVLVQRMGLIGVAWGTVLPHLITTTIIVPIYTLHVVKLDPAEYLRQVYLRPALCALPLLVLGYMWLGVEHTSWPRLASQAIAMCVVFGLASFFYCLDRGQRALISGKVVTMFHRGVMVHEA
jgi:O-antigen/teichoic acid export membrane protein